MRKRNFVFFMTLALFMFAFAQVNVYGSEAGEDDDKDFIRWMDFEVPLAILKQAYKYDIESRGSETPLDFVQLLAYTAARGWGSFKGSGPSVAMDEVVQRLQNGERLNEITQDMKLYDFYLSAYEAVLGGFVGEYEIETESGPKRCYGLKVFSPIAKGFYFTHSDDFGNPRNYGYRRPHLGHDLFGSTGAPIISVEDGIVEAMGWNQYGGWRIGIRSLDGKRYYYYAHLRKDKPYSAGLELGGRVSAGDVIGYLGATGYSRRENISNIKVPHLHFGMQIIFDESQKDGKNQIWIDTYNIVRFLGINRMEVIRDADGEYKRGIYINNAPME